MLVGPSGHKVCPRAARHGFTVLVGLATVKVVVRLEVVDEHLGDADVRRLAVHHVGAALVGRVLRALVVPVALAPADGARVDLLQAVPLLFAPALPLALRSGSPSCVRRRRRRGSRGLAISFRLWSAGEAPAERLGLELASSHRQRVGRAHQGVSQFAFFLLLVDLFSSQGLAGVVSSLGLGIVELFRGDVLHLVRDMDLSRTAAAGARSGAPAKAAEASCVRGSPLSLSLWPRSVGPHVRPCVCAVAAGWVEKGHGSADLLQVVLVARIREELVPHGHGKEGALHELERPGLLVVPADALGHHHALCP